MKSEQKHEKVKTNNIYIPEKKDKKAFDASTDNIRNIKQGK